MQTKKRAAEHTTDPERMLSLRTWADPADKAAHADLAHEAFVDCGWGRLIFGQTFATPSALADALGAEASGERDIVLYAREPHVVLAEAPQLLFLDPSHTYRLDFLSPAAGRQTGGEAAADLDPRWPPKRTPTRSTVFICRAAWCRCAKAISPMVATSQASACWWPKAAKAACPASSWASITPSLSTIPTTAQACGPWRSIRRRVRPASAPRWCWRWPINSARPAAPSWICRSSTTMCRRSRSTEARFYPCAGVLRQTQKRRQRNAVRRPGDQRRTQHLCPHHRRGSAPSRHRGRYRRCRSRSVPAVFWRPLGRLP